MAKQKESRLVQRIRKALDQEFGGRFFKTHGGAFQESGLSDLIGCIEGYFIALEVKRPKGKRATEIQLAFIDDIKESGGYAAVITSVDEAIKTIRKHLWTKIFEDRIEKKSSGCWEFLGHKGPRNYGYIKFKGKNWRAHRLSYWLYRKSFDLSLNVCHSCDNPSCIYPYHLWIGTHKQNNEDMRDKGRANPASGIDNGQAKLTEDDVRQIRIDLIFGKSQRAIAKNFGVTHGVISSIARRKTWAHVR